MTRPWQLFVALALATPAIARSQGSISIQAGATTTIQVAPNGRFVVPVIADMSTAAGTDLAALTARITWNQARLTLDSATSGGFGSVTANTSTAPAGSASFSAFSVTGTVKNVTLVQLFFSARAVAGTSDIAVTPTVAGNEVGHPILTLIKSRPVHICVAVAAASCPR